ncbi:hypothetical protein ACFWDN_13120 [Micromonospora chalcea]
MDNLDGGTVSPKDGVAVPATGYAVGQRGIKGQFHYWEILDWVRRELPAVVAAGHYFGVWFNEGTYYLDVVKIHSELVPACRDAHERGELAIYDLGGQREIEAADYVLAQGVEL